MEHGIPQSGFLITGTENVTTTNGQLADSFDDGVWLAAIKPGQGIENDDEEKPWDIALYFTQDVWHAEGNPNRKVVFLMGGTAGPDNPQFAQYNFFSNVEGFGLIPSRPHDRMGVAGWWNGFSDNFTDLISPVADFQDLYGFELYYNYQINKWMHLSPDIQLVQNEWKDDDMAVIFGVRLVIDL